MQADLDAILEQIQTYLPQHRPARVVERNDCSNLVTEIWFDSRRAVLIKRPRHPHLTDGMEGERAAALLLNRSDIVAPLHLPTSHTAENGPPYLAYWRIPMPTLSELWPSLSAQQRRTALRTLGSLMRALHRVRVPSFGRLPEALSGSRTLAAFLHEDLAYRLLPAVRSGWEAGVPLVSSLVEYLPSVVQRVEGRFPTLTHGDLFAGNVLCANQSGHCEGLIDLEDATANVPEADIARLELLHGPMMGQPWCGDWMEEVLVGYAARPDPLILRFYAAYHLANFAFHAAVTGRPDVAARFIDHAHEDRNFTRLVRRSRPTSFIGLNTRQAEPRVSSRRKVHPAGTTPLDSSTSKSICRP